jgi:hypothetical protein
MSRGRECRIVWNYLETYQLWYFSTTRVMATGYLPFPYALEILALIDKG